MVRGRSRKGFERGIRERGVPGRIDQRAVKTHKSRRRLVVSPGEEAIKERGFYYTKVVNSRIE